MNRIVVPRKSWLSTIATAVIIADDQSVIIVHTEEDKQFALSAARRLNKTINIEIESTPTTGQEKDSPGFIYFEGINLTWRTQLGKSPFKK